MIVTKCYYCLCSICCLERANCPWKTRYQRCISHCHSQGKISPILDCDFFRRKPYPVFKVKGKGHKTVTNHQLAVKLDTILQHLGVDAEVAQDETRKNKTINLCSRCLNSYHFQNSTYCYVGRKLVSEVTSCENFKTKAALDD